MELTRISRTKVDNEWNRSMLGGIRMRESQSQRFRLLVI